MDKSEYDKVIPENRKGAKRDNICLREFNTVEEAIAEYDQAKARLLNVSSWHSYAGKGTAEFQLTDETGQPVTRAAKEGDYFRINIPAPGNIGGDGYDWVQIKTITECIENQGDLIYTAITVRPSPNPNNTERNTAHFFSDDATSTFIVQRHGTILTAEVHGRNEKPNLNTENILDKARNLAVTAGALLGFSDIQWKNLVNGILNH